ncbi:MAG: hypothetical protein OEY59_07745 [Deltaproteobacteria bacterium]|nr:hypothetical protein [Deltaproteobacteria bacterium]
MIFKKKSPGLKDLILKKAMTEIEKLLREIESDGKDLTLIKLKKYQKTHHIDCTCSKCSMANKKNNPRLRGLREYGFKVFVAEEDAEESE